MRRSEHLVELLFVAGFIAIARRLKLGKGVVRVSVCRRIAASALWSFQPHRRSPSSRNRTLVNRR